jgi:hypothetical protein
MLMALMVVLIFETKNLVCPCPSDLTRLLSMAQLEEKKLLTFKKIVPTFGLHFAFLLHIANFFQSTIMDCNLEKRVENTLKEAKDLNSLNVEITPLTYILLLQ